MQIRFGVDTNGDTNVDQYVDPGAVPAGAAVITATIQLRIRAEDRDFGYTDPDFSDNYRRIVVTRAILLRNTRV